MRVTTAREIFAAAPCGREEGGRREAAN